MLANVFLNHIGDRSRGSSLLLGVSKAAHAFKLHILRKFAQRIELLLGLTREACYKRCSKRNSGNLTAKLRNKLTQGLFVALSVHALQYLSVAVLHRDIEIFHYLILTLHAVDKLVCDALGIAVQQAYPLQPVYLAKLVQQLRQRKLSVKVKTVACRILCNDDQLLNSVSGEQLSLIDDILHRAASEMTAYIGNSAVGTAVVAAVSYAQIRIMRQCGDYALALHAVGFLFTEHILLSAVTHLFDNLANPAII